MARDSDTRTVVGLPSLLQVQLPVVTSPRNLLPEHCTRKWRLSVSALSMPEHIPRSACVARMFCSRARAHEHAHEALDLELSGTLQPRPDAELCALRMTSQPAACACGRRRCVCRHRVCIARAYAAAHLDSQTFFSRRLLQVARSLLPQHKACSLHSGALQRPTAYRATTVGRTHLRSSIAVPMMPAQRHADAVASARVQFGTPVHILHCDTHCWRRMAERNDSSRIDPRLSGLARLMGRVDTTIAGSIRVV